MQEEKIKGKKSKLTAGLEKKDAAARGAWLVRIGKESIYLGVAYLLGGAQILFGTAPLGLALLCGSGAHVLPILIGLILSTLSQLQSAPIYIMMYLVAAIVRVVSGIVLEAPDNKEALEEHVKGRIDYARLLSETYDAREHVQDGQGVLARLHLGGFFSTIRGELAVAFNEHVRLRMATAAICTLIVSLYRVITGGFAYYDWFATVFFALVAPAATMVYAVYLDGHKASKWAYTVSGAALLFSVVWSANGLYVIGFSLSIMLALLLTLYVCSAHGVALGCFAGLLGGLAIDFLYAPAFLIAALLFCFFQQNKTKPTAGILPAVMGAFVWLLYAEGVVGMTYLLPSLLAAGAIFTPLCISLKKGKENASERDTCAEAKTIGRHWAANKQVESSALHLRNISEAFSTLSEMFYNLSDRFRRPGTLDLRCICDRAFDTHCKDCPNKSVCWGLEYSNTLSTVNDLISSLHTKGKVTSGQIPPSMLHRCRTVDAILEDINRDCARLTGELLRNNRTEIFAMDYEAAASIINDALEEDGEEYRFDPALEEKIMIYLRDAGVLATAVTVYGQRRRQILVRGADIEHATVTAETLRGDLGEMCGMRLSLPTFELENGVSTMLLQTKKKITVMGAQNNVSADGGVSGDTVNLFANKKDFFYALINDGMGSGREAALTSNLCSVFLEKMLRAGNRASTSLRMLNNLIRSRHADSVGECSSTVDLLEVDLMTSEAVFLKNGAAPSFVVRGGTVHRLQSSTAPIGIIKSPDTQIKRFALRPGDLIIMVSDGIEQNDPECKWLISYLSDCVDATPEEIVYRICLHASEGEHRDDCSAIALQIREADEE